MSCSKCKKETITGTFFCNWCGAYLNNNYNYKKASISQRFIALLIDGIIAIFVLVLSVILFGPFGFFIALVLLWGVNIVAYFPKGQSIGKSIIGLRVIKSNDGKYAETGTMLMREIIGKFVSGFFAGLGFFWALWDANNQGWHDKFVSTLVIEEEKSVNSQSLEGEKNEKH